MDDRIELISDKIVMADRIAGGTIRGLFNEEYPNDSKYAKLMSQYFGTPINSKYESKLWDMWRDWAKKRRLSLKDMKAMLTAYDSGVVNKVLGGNPRGPKDLNEIASRLRISGKINWRKIYEDLDGVDVRVSYDTLTTLEDLIDRNFRDVHEDHLRYAIRGLEQNLKMISSDEERPIVENAIRALTLEMKAQSKGRHASLNKVAARFVLYHRFGTSDSQRKAIKKGSLATLNRWAQAQGFDWVKKNSNVFGGYWEDPVSRDTYEFDTV